eukprot:CAMPEP_0168229570 /NCGR_PEP_ID=MMETSP0140_2-20121125/15358_1 /TAXON_ID=44445 /ORGANISM="Pseudo-nitzschia australis, Strain 10249 10 AB" /LENGTH=118 /DNA_ID=CAMNT_0008161415 /DNA_START=437 /DNA_END=792 /DNA_ORIENTATION=+
MVHVYVDPDVGTLLRRLREPSSSNNVGSSHLCEFQVRPIKRSTKSLVPFPDTKNILRSDEYISGGETSNPTKKVKIKERSPSQNKVSAPLEKEALPELARDDIGIEGHDISENYEVSA